MATRRTPTSSPPTLDREPRVFRSPEHLAAWHRGLEDTVRALRTVSPGTWVT